MATTVNPVYGMQQLATDSSDFNLQQFMIQQMINRINTATMVVVKTVYSGGTAAVGTVDIQPLVSQVCGDGSTIPHTTVYNIPYFRYQGGTNAVIVDPQVGDVGFAVFADHDVSTLQQNIEAGQGASPAPPGSARRFDFADALYIGGWCANIAPPASYVQVIGGTVNVVNPTKINLQITGGATAVLTAQGMKITGTLEVTGLVMADASMFVGGQMYGIDGSTSTPIYINAPLISTTTMQASTIPIHSMTVAISSTRNRRVHFSETA